MQEVFCDNTFLHGLLLDPYIRKFVRHFCHSHHGYFIDPRHISATIHRWTAFVMLPSQPILRTLSADFTGLLTVSVSAYTASRSIRVGASGRYSLISPIGLSVRWYKTSTAFCHWRLVAEQVALMQ